MLSYVHPAFSFDPATLTLRCKKGVYLPNITVVLRIESSLYPSPITWRIAGDFDKGMTVTRDELTPLSTGLSGDELRQAIES